MILPFKVLWMIFIAIFVTNVHKIRLKMTFLHINFKVLFGAFLSTCLYAKRTTSTFSS